MWLVYFGLVLPLNHPPPFFFGAGRPSRTPGEWFPAFIVDTEIARL